MDGVRVRKSKKDRHVSFSADVIANENQKRSFPFKFLIITILVTMYIIWPVPKLTPAAQEWFENGVTYHYREYQIFFKNIRSDVQNGPVLLILHGFPSSSFDWRNYTYNLQRIFSTILIPDMLGLGFSDKPSYYDYTVKEQADIQEALLQHLNFTHVHILAHDYGDTIAQELVARNNRDALGFNIVSLCLTNGGILPSSYFPRPIQKVLLLPLVPYIMPYIANRFLFKSRFSAIFGNNTQPSSDYLSDIYSIIVYNDGLWSFPFVMRYMHERKEFEERWVNALKKTTVPLHLIYGPADPINPPETFLASYQQLIPHSSVDILEGIGHYPQLENKTEFLQSYQNFFQKIQKQ